MKQRWLSFFLLGLAIVALVSTAQTRRASAAGPGGCGALNARPCTIFERIPSCDAGLVELAGRCLRRGDCGDENERACLVVERTPSCNSRNLVERQGQCIHPPCGRENLRACTIGERIPSCDDTLVEIAGKCLRRGDCGAEGKRACTIGERVPSCNAGLVERQGQCIRLACGRPNDRACTIAERVPSCDAGLVEIAGRCLQRGDCGEEGERACLVAERVPSCNAGLVEKQARCIRLACGRLNDRACTVAERVPSCDAGLIELSGKCLRKGDCGEEGERACLLVERTPSCNANLVEKQGRCIRVACGRLNDRACTIAERVPSCDTGLVEIAGKCLQRGICGAENQRPCLAIERIPSCNTDLVAKNAQCIHPDCGRMGERACTVTERLASCDATLKEIPGCSGECKGSKAVCANMSIGLAEPATNWEPVPGPVDPMSGWADLHVHMFSYLGFGGVFMAGAAYDKVKGVSGALGPDWGTDLDVVNSNGVVSAAVGKCPALIPNCGKNLFHGDHVGLIDDFVGHGGGDMTFSAFGAPTFNAWPTWESLTHQQVYWKWLERAWRGGMRLMTMLTISNEAACKLSRRVRGTDCTDSMPATKAQIDEAIAFEGWLDAREGGAGKGWFRIVRTPDEAEQTIRAGKLAVVLGIEVDTLFNCKQKHTCTSDFVSKEVDRYYAMGVRHIYPIHDFDGAFGGTAMFIGDLDTANHMIEGEYFDLEPCPPGMADVLFKGVIGACNKKGLTELGRQLIIKLMDKGMLIDIDHMSVKSIQGTFALADQHGGYPLMVGHGLFGDMHAADKKRHERMRTPAQLEKLWKLGGLVSVMTQNERTSARCLNSTFTFKDDYEYAVSKMGGAAAAAIPFGSDLSGVARHIGPRFGDDACFKNTAQKAAEEKQPRLAYPFVIPGFGKFQKQVTGQRTYDFNIHGLAHVGLYPDLIADLAREGTNMAPLFRSAAGYVASWRKAVTASAVVIKPTQIDVKKPDIPATPVRPVPAQNPNLNWRPLAPK